MLDGRRIGICLLSVTPLDRILSIARAAEANGIDSIWMAEGYQFFRSLGEPKSSTSIAAAIAASTEHIHIGLGIVPPYTRHPGLLAMEAHTLWELSRGRFMLGMGAAKAAALHMGWSEQDLRAATTHREAIEIVRRCLEGEAFRYEGKVYRMDAPPRLLELERPRVPLLIGATGPKMLELAGELADAVLLPTFTSAAFVAYAKEQLARGAAKAGRRVADIPIGATLPFSVAEDGDEARHAIRKLTAVYIANKIQNIRNDVILSSAGLTEAEALSVSDAVRNKGAAEAAAMVTDEILEKLVIAGTPDEVTKKLIGLADAGCTLPLLYQLLGPDPEKAVRLVAERIKPAFERSVSAARP